MIAINTILRTTLIAIFVLFLLPGCDRRVAGKGMGHGNEHDEEPERGPHGGRLLSDDDSGLALEMTIFEPGIPPQSRVYPFLNGRPLPPGEVEVTVELHRFDRIDTLGYKVAGDFLAGDQVVAEPHSFEVKVSATYKGRSHFWSYESYEGRAKIPAESARLSGIGVEAASGRSMVRRIPVLGEVGFDQNRIAHVSPRYTGVVQSLNKGLGDTVRRGETLAVLVGTDSLNAFSVPAPTSGLIVEKRVTVGEVAAAGSILFVVADLKQVWVDFTVYRQDIARVKPKQAVRILPAPGFAGSDGTIAYISPMGNSASQSVTARAYVSNSSGLLRPGLFVKGEIAVEAVDAPVVVHRDAVQTFRDWDVVFRNRGDVYEIAVLELGIVDGSYVEVLSGLSPGDTYVVRNSFVVKADVGKAGASHDH